MLMLLLVRAVSMGSETGLGPDVGLISVLYLFPFFSFCENALRVLQKSMHSAVKLMLKNMIQAVSCAGSGFKSNNMFLFGSIKMDIKLVPADSAGTVTAYYVSLNPLLSLSFPYGIMGLED